MWGDDPRYDRVQPVGVRSALRLQFGKRITPFMRILGPNWLKTDAPWIPGGSNLTVSYEDVLARIRPESDDLYILAAAGESGPASWFQVKPGEVVVDVGAHIGRYTLIAAKNASKVIAVEPDPSNFSMLEENIRLNGFSNVMAFRLALDNQRGKIRLYQADRAHTGMSSILRSWLEDSRIAKIRGSLEVGRETLDSLTESLGLQVIDWLKVDVEGREVQVLEGARNTLLRARHLILEVMPRSAEICRSLVEMAGLRLLSVELAVGGASNWFLERKG